MKLYNVIFLFSFYASCSTSKHTEAPQATPPLTLAPSPSPTATPISENAAITDYDSTVTNLPALIQAVNLAPFHQRGYHGQKTKIAILDNGFAGLAVSRGKRLPPDLKVYTATDIPEQNTAHGTKLAELVYAMATGQKSYVAQAPGPELFLMNANGYSNFSAAIDRAVALHVDILLYAQVWEYGGNFDGKGFINAAVHKATSAGILWINAAGNFGKSTYTAPLVMSARREAVLPHQRRYVRFTVKSEATAVKIVLAWNDFRDDKDYRTSQDLDLVLEDVSGHEIAASRLIQDGQPHTGQDTYSAHARETIKTDLYPGTYLLRVEVNNPDKFNNRSRIHLAIDGSDVEILDKGGESSLLIPADNADVLAIGASDVDYSSKGAPTKPEFQLASTILYDNGERLAGTSTAAAMAAGVFAVLQSATVVHSRAEVMALAGQGLLGRPKLSLSDRLLVKLNGVGFTL